MKRILSIALTLVTILIVGCKGNEHSNLADGLYAEIETSKGSILVQLEYVKTPVTVANFVSLAEGNNPFVSESYKNKPLYDGLVFHRVISKNNGDEEDFMIQGGDPLGNGTGDAGYKFKDEITDIKFDKGGYLAMANSGPGTNGSQFFITIKDTPWLNGMHTIFGHVIDKGMDVANSIVQGDAINSIKIIRKGEAAKKFDAVKVFTDYYKIEAESIKKQAAIDAAALKQTINSKVAYFVKLKNSATKLPSGLSYVINQKGSNKKPVKGIPAYVAYAGYLENGTLFDTSDPELAKSLGQLNQQKAAQNGYTKLPFDIGTKGAMIKGFEEGLSKLNYGDKAVLFIPSNLAFGENGAGSMIPPNANLIFEVQLLENN